jgi:hypothetical protein
MNNSCLGFELHPEFVVKRYPNTLQLPILYGSQKYTIIIIIMIGSPTYSLAKYLAGLLSSHLGQTLHHVKKSKDFVHSLDTLRVSSNYI